MTTTLPHGAVATYLKVEDDTMDNQWVLLSLDGAFALTLPKSALPFLSPNDTLLTTLVMTRITVGEPSDTDPKSPSK